jgi:ABC-type uncharacterized transport system involved in gliding motility auxiliary subunit
MEPAPDRGRLELSQQAILAAVQILLAGALFGLLLVLAERHNHRLDLTPTQSYVLSPEAERVAAHLTVPVQIIAFYNSQEQGQRRQMDDLLGLFAQASPRITYRLADLDRSPALAQHYGVSSFNSGVVEAAGQRRPIRAVDEQEVVNALIRLTRKDPRTLCFTTGHGEHSPRDAADRRGLSEVAKALEAEGFGIRTIDSIPADGVPAECTVVVVAGPSKDLLPGEAEALSRFVRGGGRVLLMVDPGAPRSVVELAAAHGVRVGDDVLVDERNRFLGADSFMPRVPIFDEGTFGKRLDTAAVLPLARTVTPAPETPSGVRVLLLALTSDDSWAHVDGGGPPTGPVAFDRTRDKPGPLPVAALAVESTPSSNGAEDAAGASSGRMIVFGDSDFPSNLYLNLLGNKDLFMSSVAVLAEDPDLVAVRRKGTPRSSLSPIALTAAQGKAIFWTVVVAVPGLSLLLGGLVTWRRRRRATA